MHTDDMKKKVFAGVVVALLVASVVLDAVILLRLLKVASSSTAAGNFAGPAGLPPGASSASTTAAGAAQVKDKGNAPDGTAVTGIHLILAPGLATNVATKDITTAMAWLKQNNFTVQSSGNNSILFNGTAGDIKSAFGVQVHEYSMGSSTCYSGVPADNIQLTVPSALSSFVSNILLPPSACTP